MRTGPHYAQEASGLERAQELYRSGQLKEAEEAYRRLLATKPSGDAAAGLGAILKGSGRKQEAEELYRWALENCPLSVSLLNNACNWLREQGKATESIMWLQRGLQNWPEDIHLRWGLALSLHHAEKPQQALGHLEQLLQENGNRPLLLRELVACLLSCNRLDEALYHLEQLRGLEPIDEMLLQQQLTLLQRMGRREEAWNILHAEQEATGKEFLQTRALLFLAENRLIEALPLFIKLCNVEPMKADNWLNLAACQKGIKQMVSPLKTLKMAVKLHPNRSDLRQAFGSLLIEHGKWETGLSHLLISADDTKAKDEQLFNLQFAAAGCRILSAKQLKERVKRWETERVLSPTEIWSDHIKSRSRSKRLRVGYYSQDLNIHHPVGRFIWPVLRDHNKTEIEIIGISCAKSSQSGHEEIRKYCDRWVELGMSDDIEAARHISELELDILIELGGYTGGQRIRPLTAKPAPIQLSYLGYFASTHLNCIDGIIGDNIVLPKGIEKEFPGMTLYRLSRCYMSYEQTKSLDPERTAADSRFRFGCFNHSRKLSDQCLELFARVLKENPESLLVLKSQTFGELEERERIKQRLEKLGIERERLDILKRADDENTHLKLYGNVDVALDPIPYGGATTTAEAIWMGVPVICLAGEGMVGRLSASILEGAGLSAAITKDIDNYIKLASKFALLGPRNKQQRLAIRKQVEKSELMNSKGLARAIEETYRECWHQWIKSRTS